MQLRSEVETYKEKNEKLEDIIEEKDEIIDFNRKKNTMEKGICND